MKSQKSRQEILILKVLLVSISLLVPFASRADFSTGLKDENRATKPVIVIDPGHGGEETGAVGVDGALEKDVVLFVSKRLKELLQDRLDVEVFLTREDDKNVSLAERTAFANAKRADVFLSIHTNANEYHIAHGIETYYLDNTGDQASLKLAKRENAANPGAATDVGFIVSDLIQTTKLEDSILLAQRVHRALRSKLSLYYDEVKDLGVKKAPFFVLVGAHMPCALVEISFIDHPVEGRRLVTKRYQELIGSALFEGVQRFLEEKAFIPSASPSKKSAN